MNANQTAGIAFARIFQFIVPLRQHVTQIKVKCNHVCSLYCYKASTQNL